MGVPSSTLMIKALFIAAALTAFGGAGLVYAQAATPAPPPQTPPQDVSAPAGSATRNAAPDTKKVSNTEVKREELGQKLLKRKMELDNDKPLHPAQTPDRARERNPETPADNKGQQKK
jgi:hypothetical protein